MEPVSLKSLLAAAGGTSAGFADGTTVFGRVAFDSRAARPGDLFWALRGERHDAHTFLAEALNRRPAGCVVRRDRFDPANGPQVLVDDTLAALGAFARWYRRQQNATVIGVTGSFGKTTTREMVRSVLAAAMPGVASPRNYNNAFGVPMSILDIESGHRFAVLELAASAPGEIRHLAEIAEPEIGVLTGIGPAHLEGFGSEETLARTKGDLLESLPRTGLAVLAGDDPDVRRLAGRTGSRVVYVGCNDDNHLRATDVETELGRLRFRVDGKTYELPATGRHHLTAALSAVAIGRELGLTEHTIAEGLQSFQPVPGRCRFEQIGPWTVIDDTYNANPRSLQAACDLLRDCANGRRRILVLGEMRELGERTAEFHRHAGESAAAAGIEHLVAVGEYADSVKHGAREAGLNEAHISICTSAQAAGERLEELIRPGDVVLVKGSRTAQLERIVERLRERAESPRDETVHEHCLSV